MQTETLDKLYLEWSQFTTARTSREIALEDAIKNMLFVFDRALEPGMVGRTTCDEARAVLNAVKS